MAFTIKDARGVCTASELELVKLSRSSEMKKETPARLRQKVSRARKLRDKFRDESARQAREARGKATPRGTAAAKGNERTVLKAEIFEDVLTRFESMLAAAEKKAAAAKPSTKKTTKKKVSKSASARSERRAARSELAPAKSTTVRKKTKKKTSAAASASSASEGKPPKKKSAAKKKVAKRVAKPKAAATTLTASLTGNMATVNSVNTRRRSHHETTTAERVESRLAATNRTRLKGHVSARNKRSQAKRDSR